MPVCAPLALRQVSQHLKLCLNVYKLRNENYFFELASGPRRPGDGRAALLSAMNSLRCC